MTTTTNEGLCAMDRRTLAEHLANGEPVDPERLVDADFHGVSLGLPRVVERATWKHFRKSFRRAPDGGVAGFNVRLEGRPGTFGPYRVRPQRADECPFPAPGGVILDYGAEHPAWHPLATVRDVIVAVDASQDLFLGAMYVELAGVRLRTPSFFTLARE